MESQDQKVGLSYMPGSDESATGSTPSNDLNTGSETSFQAQAEAPKEIKLSDGRVAVVAKGKGKHAMMAQRISNGNQEKYLAAMITQLTTIGGAGVVIEDLEELPLSDYLLLQAEFAEQNF